MHRITIDNPTYLEDLDTPDTKVAIRSSAQDIHRLNPAYLRLVAIFYFFQGAYYLGTNLYVYTMMANWGVPTSVQGTVLAILGLPLYLKAFTGLLTDRLPLLSWGRRKPYFVIGAILYGLGFTCLISLQQFNALWVGAVLIPLIAWMIVDSALDGLTVEITPPMHSAQMQSAAKSGRYIGMALGGFAVPFLGPRLGWMPVLIGLGIGALFQCLAALSIRIPDHVQAFSQPALPTLDLIQAAFTRRLTWFSMAFFLFFSAGQYTGTSISIYLLSESGWSSHPDKMSLFSAIAVGGSLAGAVGAMIVGRLPEHYFHSPKLFLAYLVLFWGFSLSWLAADRNPNNLMLIYLAVIVISVLLGVGSTLSLALVMRVCTRSLEGFTFAIMVSFESLGTVAIGQQIITALAAPLGGLIPAIYTLIPFALISLIFLRHVLKELSYKPES